MGMPIRMKSKTKTKIRNFGVSWLSEKAIAFSCIRKMSEKKRVNRVVSKKTKNRIPSLALFKSKMISDGQEGFHKSISNTPAILKTNGDRLKDLNSAALSSVA